MIRGHGWDYENCTFVTSDKPCYTIIGYNDMVRNPNCSHKVLNNNNISHRAINVTRFRETLERFEYFFKGEIKNQSVCTFGKHTINTGENSPIAARNHRISVHWEKEIDEQFEKLLKNGIIRSNNSLWCSRDVPIAKKNGQLRLCIDYRPLTQITFKDKLGIPRTDDILDAVNQAKYFSTLDATSGYHQIQLNEEDFQKSALNWKGAHYEYRRMPFGICNAPVTFQRIMTKVLKKELWKCAAPYLNDIII